MPRAVQHVFGLDWPADSKRVEILKYCIRQGGEWTQNGKRVGAPLFDLYREMQSCLWPDYDHSDWSDLFLRTILDERFTLVAAPKDSGKTNGMARFALCDYFCFPDETLILMSSTDLRGLQLRVWGEIKDLFNRARDTWSNAPGFAVDSLYGIFTDQVGDDGTARDIRKGLICIPVTDSEGKWTGMRRWVGVKQKRRRVLADELQFYPAPYISTLSNLDKGDFKFVGCGNPIGEGDPLDKLSEPQDGWDSLPEVTTTTTWRNRFGGVTINFVGSDSPAIRNPGQFTYLINQGDIDRIITYWGKDSAEYWNQALGVRRPGISARRVLTRDMARQFGALDNVIWKGSGTVKIVGLDAAYGGDRCVLIVLEFGLDINGVQVAALSAPQLVPVKLYAKSVPESERLLPEDQIATFVRDTCERLGIAPSNVFYDSTGRGSLGTSFARIWSADVNPIEFGGSPSTNPVCSDLYILDEKTKQKRLKRADEHYSKRVTELWFAVRYCVEGRQLRDLPEAVLDEFAAREWMRTKQNKIELESKEDMKPRFGRSPDLADAASIAMAGAIRLGFRIKRLEAPQQARLDEQWKDKLRQLADQERRSYNLNLAA